MECGQHFFCNRVYECRYSILHFCAALLVAAMASISNGLMLSFSMRWAMRCVRTRFLRSSAGDYQHWAMSTDDSVVVRGEVLKNVVVAHCVV